LKTKVSVQNTDVRREQAGAGSSAEDAMRYFTRLLQRQNDYSAPGIITNCTRHVALALQLVQAFH